MPNIKPVSDLRNYSEVLSEVRENEPVYLTKNGRGSYAIVEMEYVETFERMKAELELFTALYKAEKRSEKEGWISAEEMKKQLGIEA